MRQGHVKIGGVPSCSHGDSVDSYAGSVGWTSSSSVPHCFGQLEISIAKLKVLCAAEWTVWSQGDVNPAGRFVKP